MVTLVYLQQSDDVGGVLQQFLDEQPLWSLPFRVVRLWQEDAVAAVASGLPGLTVLSPLMRGACVQVVEQALRVVLEQEGPGRQQADLLTILGIFADFGMVQSCKRPQASTPLIETERFVRMVGREPLMASDLIIHLPGRRNTEPDYERSAGVLRA